MVLRFLELRHNKNTATEKTFNFFLPRHFKALNLLSNVVLDHFNH